MLVMPIVQCTLCSFCKEVPTQHRCMHRVEEEGVLLEADIYIASVEPAFGSLVACLLVVRKGYSAV